MGIGVNMTSFFHTHMDGYGLWKMRFFACDGTNVNCLFLEYGPLNTPVAPEYLPQHYGVTGIGNLFVQGILDEVKEGIEQGIAKALGCLLRISIKAS